MPSITIITTQITEQRADGRMSHKEFPETAQTISCTSVADGATKLQTALTPLVGSSAAAVHATSFTNRQNLTVAPTKHIAATTNGQGVSVLYHP